MAMQEKIENLNMDTDMSLNNLIDIGTDRTDHGKITTTIQFLVAAVMVAVVVSVPIKTVAAMALIQEMTN